MSKKKRKQKAEPKISPENYIKTRARNLPLDKCYINSDWEEHGMAAILISRKHINENFTYSVFLVDTYCLGVKDTFFDFNVLELYDQMFENLKSVYELEEIDYVLAHNIIYGAIAYAEDLGFKPTKSFEITQYLLEEDDDKVDLIDLEFGLNGMPAIFLSKEKNSKGIIATLEKSVGEGNFLIIADGPENEDDDWDEGLNFINSLDENDFDVDLAENLFDENDFEDIDYEDVEQSDSHDPDLKDTGSKTGTD